MNLPALNLTPQQQKLMQMVDLLPGEAPAYTIQGDGFFIGSNPLQKAAAAMAATLVKLTGGHIRVFVVITNQRILLIESRQMWCGCMQIKGVQAIALAALAEAGWARETQWCCIHSRAVHLESKTQRYSLVIKHLKDQHLREFVSQLSQVMLQNVAQRTAT